MEVLYYKYRDARRIKQHRKKKRAMRVTATIIPEILESKSYAGEPSTRQQELEVSRDDALRIMNHPAWENVPVRVEHGLAGNVGRVVERFITDDGKMMCVLEFDDSKASNHLGSLLIKQGLTQQVSLKHNRLTGEPIEVSLVRRGARDGSVIHLPPQKKAPEYMITDQRELQTHSDRQAVSTFTMNSGTGVPTAAGGLAPSMGQGGITQASEPQLIPTAGTGGGFAPRAMTTSEIAEADKKLGDLTRGNMSAPGAPREPQPQQKQETAPTGGGQQQQQQQQQQQEKKQQIDVSKLDIAGLLDMVNANENVPLEVRQALLERVDEIARKYKAESDRAASFQQDNEQTKIAMAETLLPFIQASMNERDAMIACERLRSASDLRSTLPVVAASANGLIQKMEVMKEQIQRTNPELYARTAVIRNILAEVPTSQPAYGTNARRFAHDIAASSAAAAAQEEPPCQQSGGGGGGGMGLGGTPGFAYPAPPQHHPAPAPPAPQHHYAAPASSSSAYSSTHIWRNTKDVVAASHGAGAGAPPSQAHHRAEPRGPDFSRFNRLSESMRMTSASPFARSFKPGYDGGDTYAENQ